MTALERIIRPFTGARVTPPTRLSTSSETSSENAVLAVGVGGGSLKTYTGNYSSTKSFYVDAKEPLSLANTTVKRIRNEDDEDQYVDIEVPTRYKGKGKGSTYQKSTYKVDDRILQDAEVIEEKTYEDNF